MCRVAFLTVSQFAWQTGQIERAFTTGHFTCFTRGFTRTGCIDDFTDNDFRVGRVFHQIINQLLVHQRLNGGLHFGRNQFVFGLRGELRIRHFYRNHGDQAFTGIITGGADFGFLAVAFFIHIRVKRTGHRRTEAYQMGAAVALRDIVGKAVNIFLETIIPLQRHFHTDIVFHGGEIEHGWVDWGFVFVQVFHESFDTAFIMEVIVLAIAFVEQADRHTRVQE